MYGYPKYSILNDVLAHKDLVTFNIIMMYCKSYTEQVYLSPEVCLEVPAIYLIHIHCHCYYHASKRNYSFCTIQNPVNFFMTFLLVYLSFSIYF